MQVSSPDKPELNIEDLRLKICGIARAAQALAPRVALYFYIKFDGIPLRAVG